MGVLSWARPQRAIPVEEWKAISADSAPPGVYSPNMSDEDRLKWKAKKIGGKDPRVEIRKTVVGTPRKSKHGPWDNTSYAQVVLTVRPFPDDTVIMSMNGTAEFTGGEFTEMMVAVQEAALALTTHNGSSPRIGKGTGGGQL